MDCKYNTDDIDKILGFTSWSDKKKVDTLLQIDCNAYARLGSDSSKKDREEAKKISKKIYKGIKLVSPEVGTSLLQALDI